ncbi:MAG: MSCRAMM family protein [Blastocatellia bacterium]
MTTSVRTLTCLTVLLLATPFASAQSTQTDSAAKKETPWVISGLVTIDGNPTAGVLVFASHSGSVDEIGVAKGMTDAAGRYELTGTFTGAILVRPFPPTLVWSESHRGPLIVRLDGSNEEEDSPDDDLPFDLFKGSGRLIEVSAGETIDGINFPLKPGAVIKGQVLGPGGDPLIEAHLSFRRIGEKGEANIWVPNDRSMASTDDLGMYRVYGVPPGKYRISTTTFSHPTTYYPGVSDESKAELVDVASGTEVTANITVGAPVQKYSVAIQVIDGRTGTPIPNVKFTLSTCTMDASGKCGGQSGSLPTTDSDGMLMLDGLQPGSYRIDLGPEQGLDLTNGSASFQILDQDLLGLQVRLQKGAVVSGKVVLNTDRSDIQAMLSSLKLHGITDNPNIDAVHEISVNADGGFRVGGVGPGPFYISLDSSSPPGFQIVKIESPGTAGQASDDPDTPVPAALHVRVGQDLSDIKIVIAYGAGVARGRVKALGGSPPTYSLMYVSAAPLPEGELGTFGASQVDAGGRFEITGLADGQYRLSLYGVEHPTSTTITVTNGEAPFTTLTVDLSPSSDR